MHCFFNREILETTFKFSAIDTPERDSSNRQPR